MPRPLGHADAGAAPHRPAAAPMVATLAVAMMEASRRSRAGARAPSLVAPQWAGMAARQRIGGGVRAFAAHGITNAGPPMEQAEAERLLGELAGTAIPK